MLGGAGSPTATITGGNFGIGTSSPATRLHLSGPDVQLRFTNGSSHTRHLAVVDADNSFRITRTGVADDVTIDSSGRVGIGTTSPVDKLDVYGSAHFHNIELGKGGQTGNRNVLIDFTGDDTYTDYGFRIIRESGGPNANTILSNRGTGGIYLATVEAGFIALQTSNTERLRIASAGQIGIGGANYGTSGQVLTSSGASAAPSWTTITTTPADGSITYAKLSTSATEADNVSKRTAKAWVNFNGTLASTSMINGAFNVSSITDYGVGDYEVNFLVSMPDVNYATTCGSTSPVNSAHTVTFVASSIRSTYSTGAVAVASFNVTNSAQRADPANVSVIVMR
jgi:hypothetical protein